MGAQADYGRLRRIFNEALQVPIRVWVVIAVRDEFDRLLVESVRFSSLTKLVITNRDIVG